MTSSGVSFSTRPASSSSITTGPAVASTERYALPTGGDRKAVLFLQTPATERGARFSPSGEWLAYSSDESGRYEVYVQHVPSNGAKIRISPSGGTAPRWSRDGSELFYLEGNQKLMSVPVKAGATFQRSQARVLFDDSHLAGAIEPSRDGQRLLALERAEEGSQPPALTVVTNWPATLKTSKWPSLRNALPLTSRSRLRNTISKSGTVRAVAGGQLDVR